MEKSTKLCGNKIKLWFIIMDHMLLVLMKYYILLKNTGKDVRCVDVTLYIQDGFTEDYHWDKQIFNNINNYGLLKEKLKWKDLQAALWINNRH